MKKFVAYCLSIFLLSSCATAKWRQHYVKQKFDDFHARYSWKNEYEISFSCAGTKYKPIQQQTKKQVKQSFKCLESAVAIIPDSTSLNNNIIDSFYTNKNKIQYIKKHSLLTQHKHLIDYSNLKS